MPKKYRRSILAVLLLLSTSLTHAAAAVLDYSAGTNTWTFTGFETTGIAPFFNPGTGLGGAGPHARIGNGTTVAWSPGAGGFLYHNGGTEFTDYYWPLTYGFTVTGATWSNTAGNNTDGTPLVT